MGQHYCLQCGTPLTWQEIDQRPRERCPDCGWVYYRQLKLSVAAVIEDQGRLLLLRRAHDPWRGLWNLPAGYVEVDETLEQAAAREVNEETGLQVAVGGLLGTYFFDDDPRGNGLLIAYRCQIVGGELVIGVEANGWAYFAPHELPADVCGAGHERIVAAWQRGEFQENS